MTRTEFSRLFFSLALQLRATVGEPDLRAYYAALQHEPEPLVRAAAERFMRDATWFPKTSEWMQAIRVIENERRELQREATRRVGALCEVCEDTGWMPAEAHGVRGVTRCVCWTRRRAERLGAAVPPPPALPPVPSDPDPLQLARIKAAVLPFVKEDRDERRGGTAARGPVSTNSGVTAPGDDADGNHVSRD